MSDFPTGAGADSVWPAVTSGNTLLEQIREHRDSSTDDGDHPLSLCHSTSRAFVVWAIKIRIFSPE